MSRKCSYSHIYTYGSKYEAGTGLEFFWGLSNEKTDELARTGAMCDVISIDCVSPFKALQLLSKAVDHAGTLMLLENLNQSVGRTNME